MTLTNGAVAVDFTGFASSHSPPLGAQVSTSVDSLTRLELAHLEREVAKQVRTLAKTVLEEL